MLYLPIMKKTIKSIFIVFALLALAILGILAYHGFFSAPQVTEKEIGPYTVATKRFLGSYYKVGPAMTEVDNGLKEMGIKATKGVGLFWDDPAKAEESKLRSDVGNVLEGVDAETLNKIRGKFEVREIGKIRAVVVEHPIKSMLSYMLAPMKVYPAINKYWSKKGYSTELENFSLEIYDVPGKTTLYIMPIPEK